LYHDSLPRFNGSISNFDNVVHGGRTVYGQALGVLMLDTRFPRLPGDVGNATTWPFPVEYRIVRGADPSRIMGLEPDPGLLEPFVEAARERSPPAVDSWQSSSASWRMRSPYRCSPPH
jgi:hypothetical protein